MKQKEWDRRICMNLEGVQLLGSALLGRTEMHLKAAKERLAGRLIAGSRADIFKWPYGVEHYEQDVRTWEDEFRGIRLRLKTLATPEGVLARSTSLRPMDFRFRWDQLRDHLVLVGYLSDDQPDFVRQAWDLHTPICKRWGDAATVALTSVFISEYKRLSGLAPEDVPRLQTEADYHFYLTVWKHCELEPGRGHPKGGRWEDGRSQVASYAYSLREDADEEGSPITNDEAIRRALRKFDIVSSEEFIQRSDKSNMVVSNAGASPADRLDGAIKAVRKLLVAIDLAERDPKKRS